MHVLLPYYGIADYTLFPTEKGSAYELPSGGHLQFYMAPHMHSPGSITVYDDNSQYLFSSDIWAAIDPNWKMIVRDFEAHKLKLDFFHKEYMASNIATCGFVRSIEHLEIQAILPQHGEIIPTDMIPPALDYLRNLQCGTALCYADL